jgi:hypothetical protein
LENKDTGTRAPITKKTTCSDCIFHDYDAMQDECHGCKISNKWSVRDRKCICFVSVDEAIQVLFKHCINKN